MSRAPTWLLLAPIVVVLLFPGAAMAQHSDAPMQILVQVRLPGGQPAPQGSLCEMDLENTEMLDQGQTDSSGKCRFVPQGHNIYLIRIRAAGYLEARERVDLQNSSSWYGNITLRPDPNHPSDDSGASAPGPPISAFDLSVSVPARKEFDLGQHALESHDLDGGIAHLKKAIKLHDPYPQACTLLGMAYNEQKKWKDAQGALEKAIQQDPKAVEAYFQLGASLNQQKDHAGAAKALNQGLELNPDALHAAAAHYELARAYLALGQWQDANPHAAKAVAMQPDVASWHILMGNIDLKKGDGQGAITEFQAYLKLDPNGTAAASVHDMIPKIQAAMQKK